MLSDAAQPKSPGRIGRGPGSARSIQMHLIPPGMYGEVQVAGG